MNLLAWLKAKRKLEVIRRDESNLTLADWRSEESLVSLASRVLSNPDFRLMLSVLRNEHPGLNVLSHEAQPHHSIAVQRRAEGYTMALANLESMGKLQQKPEQLEATFEPEDPEMYNRTRV